MNIYCDLCVNKDRDGMCGTCTRDLLRMTTDGAEYGLPSNYSCIYKPVAHSLDADALKATINKLFGTGLTVLRYHHISLYTVLHQLTSTIHSERALQYLHIRKLCTESKMLYSTIRLQLYSGMMALRLL